MSTPTPLPFSRPINDINMEEDDEDDDLTPLHTPVVGDSAAGRNAAAVGEGEGGESEGEEGDVQMVDVEGEGAGAGAGKQYLAN